MFAGTKEDRPGVVMRLIDAGNRALVLVGTRTFRPDFRHVKIEPKSAAGYALQLYAPTYFYQSGSIAIAKAEAIRVLGPLCPPEVFFHLEELIGSRSTPK